MPTPSLQEYLKTRFRAELERSPLSSDEEYLVGVDNILALLAAQRSRDSPGFVDRASVRVPRGDTTLLIAAIREYYREWGFDEDTTHDQGEFKWYDHELRFTHASQPAQIVSISDGDKRLGTFLFTIVGDR